MNEHQKVSCLTAERRQYAPFLKMKSTDINLLSWLIGLSDRNGRSSLMIGQIACQSNSLKSVFFTLNFILICEII